MITVYDSSGTIVGQYEEWQRETVRTDVDNHNHASGDSWKIAGDVSGIIFDNGEYREKTDAEKVAAGEMTSAELYAKELAACYTLRRAAYVSESDGLFFDYQRGDATKDEWEAAVAAIKTRYPKP